MCWKEFSDRRHFSYHLPLIIDLHTDNAICCYTLTLVASKGYLIAQNTKHNLMIYIHISIIQWSVVLLNNSLKLYKFMCHFLFHISLILLLQNVMRVFWWTIINRMVLIGLQNVCTNASLTALPHYRLLLLISVPWNVHEGLLQCRNTCKIEVKSVSQDSAVVLM